MNMKQLPNVIEAILLAVSSVFVIWMIRRIQVINTLGYNTRVESYGGFLRLALALSILIPISQIGIVTVKIIDKDADDMPQLLFKGYTLLAEYLVIVITGWVTSCIVLILKRRLLDETREWSLLSFWGFNFALHATSGTLRIIVEDYDTWIDQSEIILHFFSGVASFCLALVSLLNWTNAPKDSFVRRMSLGNTLLLSTNSVDSPIKISAKKYKVVDKDIECTMSVIIEGRKHKVKRTYRNFALFDLKVIRKASRSWRRSTREKSRTAPSPSPNYPTPPASNQ